VPLPVPDRAVETTQIEPAKQGTAPGRPPAPRARTVRPRRPRKSARRRPPIQTNDHRRRTSGRMGRRSFRGEGPAPTSTPPHSEAAAVRSGCDVHGIAGRDGDGSQDADGDGNTGRDGDGIPGCAEEPRRDAASRRECGRPGSPTRCPRNPLVGARRPDVRSSSSASCRGDEELGTGNRDQPPPGGTTAAGGDPFRPARRRESLRRAPDRCGSCVSARGRCCAGAYAAVAGRRDHPRDRVARKATARRRGSAGHGATPGPAAVARTGRVTRRERSRRPPPTAAVPRASSRRQRRKWRRR
jgi:hypothetical protein